MSVAILVPRLPGDEWRERAWAHIADHYQTNHPDWELVEGTSEPWSRSRAINAAVAATDVDTFVIADADSWVEPENLTRSVAELDHWAVPFTTIRRLNRASTERVLAGESPARKGLARHPYPAVPGGGITVITRDAFESLHGYDERFYGWGGEETSFGMAARVLIGEPARAWGPLWHLWHPPSPDRYPGDSKTLLARYRSAKDDPDLMRALVEETP